MSKEKQIEEMAVILASNCGNCSECDSYHKEINGVDACYHKYAGMMYNAGYRKQEWISVEERLPETTCECLAVGKSGCIFLLCYSSRYMAFNATDGDGDDRWKLNDITHWMPLPEPPKGE